MGRREMAVHTIRHKTLGVVHMGGGLPCVVSKLDLMASGTKLRGGSANHGVIGDAEKGKGDDDAYDYKYNPFEEPFHDKTFRLSVRTSPKTCYF